MKTFKDFAAYIFFGIIIFAQLLIPAHRTVGDISPGRNVQVGIIQELYSDSQTALVRIVEPVTETVKSGYFVLLKGDLSGLAEEQKIVIGYPEDSISDKEYRQMFEEYSPEEVFKKISKIKAKESNPIVQIEYSKDTNFLFASIMKNLIPFKENITLELIDTEYIEDFPSDPPRFYVAN